jgi:hypothetical protein
MAFEQEAGGPEVEGGEGGFEEYQADLPRRNGARFKE